MELAFKNSLYYVSNKIFYLKHNTVNFLTPITLKLHSGYYSDNLNVNLLNFFKEKNLQFYWKITGKVTCKLPYKTIMGLIKGSYHEEIDTLLKTLEHTFKYCFIHENKEILKCSS